MVSDNSCKDSQGLLGRGVANNWRNFLYDLGKETHMSNQEEEVLPQEERELEEIRRFIRENPEKLERLVKWLEMQVGETQPWGMVKGRPKVQTSLVYPRSWQDRLDALRDKIEKHPELIGGQERISLSELRRLCLWEGMQALEERVREWEEKRKGVK